MDANEHIENQRATSEAQKAVVGRPNSSSRSTVEAALKRYLSAEAYREQHEEDEEAGSGEH